MKKTGLTILFVLTQLVLFAQAEIELKTEIKDVVVYQQGAEISREGTVFLKKGSTTLLFKGLSSKIDSQSIRAKASNDIMIVSVSHGIDYLNKSKVSKEVELLEQQSKVINDSIKILKSFMDIYKTEENMLLSNKSIGGNNGVSVEELQNASKFFRERLFDIVSKYYEVEFNLERLNAQRSAISKQLSELNFEKNSPTSLVKVVVSSKKEIESKINLSYLIYEAGWTPNYDIRIREINEPLNLSYKAKVYQNTGEDWEDVDLVLSTGNPSVSNVKPELSVYFLEFYNYYRYPSALKEPEKMLFDESMELKSVEIAEEETEEEVVTESAPVMIPLGIRKNRVSTEFEIEIPYSIPSDNKEYDVSMIQYVVPSEYNYSAVPKLSKDAFLMARVTDWAQYNLLDGKADIFFKGVYQGETYLNLQFLDDTLALSVGRDNDIVIERKMKKDFAGKSFIGNVNKDSKGWDIAVKNNKSISVRIIVEDQFPVSKDSEIKVDLIESSEAVINQDTGKLKWVLDLKPNEKKILTIKYTVKYPKDKSLDVD